MKRPAIITPEFGLETPCPLAPYPGYLRLEGWGFVPGTTSPTQVRIRIDETTHSPRETLPREDVGTRFPAEPAAAQSGFLFVILLPTGVHHATLEFSGDSGATWIKARDLIVPVTPQPVMGQFEPAGSKGKITAPTRLAGWCWHPDLEITSMVVLQGDVEVPVDQGLERPDVAARFPDQPAARYAGFLTRENLPRGQGKIRLQVGTHCGRCYFVDPVLAADISEGAFAPPRPPPAMWDLPASASLPTKFPLWLAGKIPPGNCNILFILSGDFTGNSAYHVTALANELIARGYDCVVAVTDHPETIGAQAGARFLSLEFSELASLPILFRDGRGPQVTHLWTPRERLRKIWDSIESQYNTQLVVHLEDNDLAILSEHLQIDPDKLTRMSVGALDNLVTDDFIHPIRSRQLIEQAQGVTLIYESLADLLPPGTRYTTFWPAAGSAFGPRPLNQELRAGLGIAASDTVIFYHGNTHDANLTEVGELYEAVIQLNTGGRPTWLLRTGRDSPAFADQFTNLIGDRLIHLGFIKRAEDLPELMSAADIFVQPGAPGAFNDYRFPSKLPEFFALGRPVVLPAANLGNELIHGEDAYVLPAANAVSIAAAIRLITGDPATYQRLAEGAQRYSNSHFSWSRSTDKLLAFYHAETGLGRPDQRAVAAAQLVNQSFK